MGSVLVRIEKVLELDGAIRQDLDVVELVEAHISYPRGYKDSRYALLFMMPQGGSSNLREIDPETRLISNVVGGPVAYFRAPNRVINEIYVLPDDIGKLRTMEEVLGIPGISVTRELFPD